MPRPKPRDRPLVLILSISSSLSTDMQILFDVTHFLRHRYSNSVRRSTTGLHFYDELYPLTTTAGVRDFGKERPLKYTNQRFFLKILPVFEIVSVLGQEIGGF